MAARTQLTLFVPPCEAADELEVLRRWLDPVQFGLIAAHITLCREDEIEGFDPALIRQRLATATPLTLKFGAAETFSGHGILLPCIEGEEAFMALRQRILATREIRRQAPHITLAHPRNPRAPGNEPTSAAKLGAHRSISFTSVCRIQQAGPSDPWTVRDRFPLG